MPCQIRSRRFGSMAVLGACLVSGCMEPHAPIGAPSTSPGLSGDQVGVQVLVSDSMPRRGESIVAVVRAVTPTRAPAVASYTGRLAFDTAALTFVAESPLNDGAARAINSTPGVVRDAGIATRGFATGRLFGVVFIVHDPGAVRSLVAHLDEIHDVNRDDLRSRLRALPAAQGMAPSGSRP